MLGRIIEILEKSPIVADYEIHQLIEELSAKFLRVEVTLLDGSHLFIKELLFPDGSKYSYHWQSPDGRLLIRWDNAPHHPEIATYPDHKHVGEEVLSSNSISIEEVLSAITAQIETRSNQIDWQVSRASKLWRYNLHYFDYAQDLGLFYQSTNLKKLWRRIGKMDSSDSKLGSFDKYAAKIDSAMNWLALSQDKVNWQGSAVYYSLINGWAASYPETTGYIIPAFINYSRMKSKEEFFSRALDMGKWLLNLQSREGWFPGGYKPSPKSEPSVFNSAQIIIGLVNLYEATDKKEYLESAKACAEWLVSVQCHDGSWLKGGYVKNYSPSYYSRVAWPILMVWEKDKNKKLYDSAKKSLNTILLKQNTNLSFKDWAFKPGKPAFTHTIAYTIRGFLESAFILNEWEKYGVPAEKTAMKLFRLFELKKYLAGAYYQDWSPVKWYTCLTGNCQIAICWLILYEINNDPRLLNAAIKLVNLTSEKQKLGSINKNIRGAIPGSSPIWGRYMTMRYPNWAAKFYVDALMKIETNLRKLI